MTPTNALSGRDAPIDRLVYHVSAGPPGERLSVSLLLPREGDAQLDHVDELHGEAASTRAILPDETWRRQLFELAGALEKPVGQEESLPDGFVRRIEIVDGQGRTTKLRVGSRTSPAIRQLVEALDAWLARAGVRLGH